MQHRKIIPAEARIVIRAILDSHGHPIFSNWREKSKQEVLNDIIIELEQQLAEPDAIQSVRMRLMDFMLIAARFDVLIMLPPTPFKPNPLSGISGGLTKYIPQLRAADQDLAAFFTKWNGPCESRDQMEGAILWRYWVLHLFVHGFNLARITLGDYLPDPVCDWFRPCYYSYRIAQEHFYRKTLGLAPAIESPDPDMRALIHRTWLNRASEGHEDLRIIWGQSWIQMFNEPSPYEGLTLA